jgi:hypothetical protein
MTAKKIDIIIPVKSTNSRFVNNLSELVRYDWVRAVILGDSGMDQEIVNQVERLPKVVVIDQQSIYSQGKCIIELAKLTEGKHFAYFHGDVTVPENWLDIMLSEIRDSAILECKRNYEYQITFTREEDKQNLQTRRPLSGTQLIDRNAFIDSTEVVQDDFLFRNEDLIFASLIEQSGYQYQKTDRTYHNHQIGYNRSNENINSTQEFSMRSIPIPSDLTIYRHQLSGLIKYSAFKSKHCRDNFDIAFVIYRHLGGKFSDIYQIMLNKPAWLFWVATLKLRMAFRRIRFIIKVLWQSDFDFVTR